MREFLGWVVVVALLGGFAICEFLSWRNRRNSDYDNTRVA